MPGNLLGLDYNREEAAGVDRLNSVSDAVLSYLRFRTTQAPEPGEVAQQQVALHIRLLENLASLEEDYEPEKATVVVYELTEQMKKTRELREDSPQNKSVITSLVANLDLFRSIRTVLRERYAANPESSLVLQPHLILGWQS